MTRTQATHRPSPDPRISTTVTLKLSVRQRLGELARERRTSMAALIALAVDQLIAEVAEKGRAR